MQEDVTSMSDDDGQKGRLMKRTRVSIFNYPSSNFPGKFMLIYEGKK